LGEAALDTESEEATSIESDAATIAVSDAESMGTPTTESEATKALFVLAHPASELSEHATTATNTAIYLCNLAVIYSV
jgi:hypothetical protein